MKHLTLAALIVALCIAPSQAAPPGVIKPPQGITADPRIKHAPPPQSDAINTKPSSSQLEALEARQRELEKQLRTLRARLARQQSQLAHKKGQIARKKSPTKKTPKRSKSQR